MLKNIKILLVILIIGFYSRETIAQNYAFGFERSDSVVVLKLDSSTYSDPWIGGLNNCQFFEVDLDLNKQNDLIVFDKHGNKIIPFLKYNSCGFSGYVFAPKYRERLPQFTSWVNSVDYNLDQNNDIFTYTLGAIKVYKNISDNAFELSEIKPRLTTDYGSGTPINLYTSEADYPGFADLNGDDAIDVVNFWALGKYVEYHQNTGVDLFQTFDSLSFRVNSSCWGQFEENESSNVLLLNSNCSSKNIISENTRHSGSTMLLLDLNGDGIKDIVIGDVDYPNLISMTNGGTLDTAKMVIQDTLFPTPTKPVKLYSMPAAASIDVDFDDLPDLLVSPFDPSRNKSENQKSIWLYKNTGTLSNPQYTFVQSDFLQDRMIDLGSGAYPTIADVDGDNLPDLVVGNWGVYDSSNYIGSFLHSYYHSSVSFFKNIGTQTVPKFQYITDDWGGLKSLNRKGFFPTLGDIDGDGDMDMIVGDETGKVLFLMNQAGINATPVFSSPILNYQNITTKSFAAPQLFDLNLDGKLDLIIGDSLGKLHYYQNTGTLTNPIFSLITDTLGGVNVRNAAVSYYGFSTPCFFRKNDTTYLAVGSESGLVYTYKNIDQNVLGTFKLIDDSTFFVRNNRPIPIYEGNRSGVAIADLNHDSYPDLILGNYSGGLTYYKGTTPPSIDIRVVEEPSLNRQKMKVFPNPTVGEINLLIPNTNVKIKTVLIYNNLMQIEPSTLGLNNTINVSNFLSGIYFIKVTTTRGIVYTSKFIKL
jgi:hypothetical protein